LKPAQAGLVKYQIIIKTALGDKFLYHLLEITFFNSNLINYFNFLLEQDSAIEAILKMC
jgi:hypothetical protein